MNLQQGTRAASDLPEDHWIQFLLVCITYVALGIVKILLMLESAFFGRSLHLCIESENHQGGKDLQHHPAQPSTYHQYLFPH